MYYVFYNQLWLLDHHTAECDKWVYGSCSLCADPILQRHPTRVTGLPLGTENNDVIYCTSF